MLSLVASLEQSSEHPLAEAIVRYAAAKGIGLHRPDNFESVTGSFSSLEPPEKRREATSGPFSVPIWVRADFRFRSKG